MSRFERKTIRLKPAGLLVSIFVVAAGSTLASAPVADVTAQQIGATLPALQHPYLYFKETDKPAIKRRIAENPECARIYAELKKKADSYFGAESTARPDMEALAFVYQMTGDVKYAQKAFSMIPRQLPNDQLFDLNASRTCRGLALLYDWLYTGLEESQRAQIRDDLMSQIARIRGKYGQTWWVTAYRCNWNPVCHSAAGVAAMALLEDDSTLLDVVAEAYNGIYKTYNELGRDGDWCEGVAYWSYGIFVSLFYADALHKLTAGQYSLFEHERLTNNPVAFGLYTLVPCGASIKAPRAGDWKSVNFEDSGDHREDGPYGYNKLAEMTGSGEALWLKKTLFGSGGDRVFDIIWPAPNIAPSLPESASKYFRDYGWVVLRNDFINPDNVMLAAVCAEHRDPTREMYISRFKGAEPIPASEKPWGIKLDTYFMSHGHLHAGTFNLYWRGQAYIAELGKVGYPNDYWTPDRWKYPFAGSVGHNVVFVNGEQQISGKGIGGRIAEFRPAADRDYTLMDVSGAYPGESLKKWRRHLVLSKPDVTVVLDEVNAARDSTIDVRFHSDCQAELQDGFMLLKGRDGLMALIPVSTSPWIFKQGKHVLPGPEVMIDKKIYSSGAAAECTDVHVLNAQERNVIATVILPVEDREQAQKVASSAFLERADSGEVTVSFQKAEKAFHLKFIPAEGGLVLK